MNKRNLESGQIALVLVLVMTVVGAAAISLAGRATIETRVQEINVDSSQAMLAAESGLEAALRNAPTDAVVTGSLDANTSYRVEDSAVGSDYVTLSNLKNVETVEINLVGGTGTGIDLFWESDPAGIARGLYVQVFSAAGVIDYSIAPAGFGTGFDSSGIILNQTLGTTNFDYRRTVPFTAGASTIMKVTVLGGESTLGYRSNGGTLANQLRRKTSVGTVVRGTDTVKQGFEYQESITDEVPNVFNYTLFSSGSIVQ